MPDMSEMSDPFDFEDAPMPTEQAPDPAPPDEQAAPSDEAPAAAEPPVESPKEDAEVARLRQEHAEFVRWWKAEGSDYQKWREQQSKAPALPAEEPAPPGEEDIYDAVMRMPTEVGELRAELAKLQAAEQQRAFQATLAEMQRDMTAVEAKYVVTERDRLDILELHEKYGYAKSFEDCAKMIRLPLKASEPAQAPESQKPAAVVPPQGARKPADADASAKARREEWTQKLRAAKDPFEMI